MRLVIEVTPGDFATPADLAAHAENILALVRHAVAGIAGYDYPEFRFSEVEILPDATDTSLADCHVTVSGTDQSMREHSALTWQYARLHAAWLWWWAKDVVRETWDGIPGPRPVKIAVMALRGIAWLGRRARKTRSA